MGLGSLPVYLVTLVWLHVARIALVGWITLWFVAVTTHVHLQLHIRCIAFGPFWFLVCELRLVGFTVVATHTQFPHLYTHAHFGSGFIWFICNVYFVVGQRLV